MISSFKEFNSFNSSCVSQTHTIKTWKNLTLNINHLVRLSYHRLNDLDIRFVKEWTTDCTHYMTQDLKMSSILINALIDAKVIVNQMYFEDLISSMKIPDSQCYLPTKVNVFGIFIWKDLHLHMIARLSCFICTWYRQSSAVCGFYFYNNYKRTSLNH